jgi:Polyketide cyclase / dehydrase and lipid transport
VWQRGYRGSVAHDPLPATGSVSVAVGVAPEALWRLVSDPMTPARFSPELQDAAFADGGGPRVGAEIEGHNQSSAFSWTTRSTVVECEEPTRFAWCTGGTESPGATWSFEVEPTPGGSTLTHRVVFHEGGEPLTSAVAAEPARGHEIVEQRLAQVLDGMQHVVAGIADLADGTGPDAPSR